MKTMPRETGKLPSQPMQNAHHSAYLSEIPLSGGFEIRSAHPSWLRRETVTSAAFALACPPSTMTICSDSISPLLTPAFSPTSGNIPLSLFGQL